MPKSPAHSRLCRHGWRLAQCTEHRCQLEFFGRVQAEREARITKRLSCTVFDAIDNFPIQRAILSERDRLRRCL